MAEKEKNYFGTLLSSLMVSITLFLANFKLIPQFITKEIGTTYVLAYALCILTSLYIIESFRDASSMLEEIIKMKRREALHHLAAAFGHEIRQPITISKGMLQLIQEDTWGKEEQKEYLKIAIDELNRSERIVKNYQFFCKFHYRKNRKL